MLKLLIKKQLGEVFRGYFYDARKNRMRSKTGIVLYFILFFVLMAGVLGGMFTGLSLLLCEGLHGAGMGWMYFTIMGFLSLVLGAFGSIFNSYSGLYMAKDNDQLLAMPIPVKYIIASRLINVYLLGIMYSIVVILPALVVYWIVAEFSLKLLLCGIGLILIIGLIVLVLSCILGWCVAKIGQRLKNKSFVKVLVSLVFIGLYYFFYFKANELIQDILNNAVAYGEKIKGAAYGLYLFGRIGEGNLSALAIFAGVVLVLMMLTWRILSRSFLSLTTAGNAASSKTVNWEEKVKARGVLASLLAKEFGRFTSSANYMLNCGLGILFLPVAGILVLLQGERLIGTLNLMLAGRPGVTYVVTCVLLCAMSAMNDMVTPSISLEGKSLWIPKSLPVDGRKVLLAKVSVQLILTEIPMLFAAICVAAACPVSAGGKLLIVLFPLIYVLFSSLFGLFIGLKMPNLTWTNELVPIKQSGGIMISLFGGWALSVAIGVLYAFLAYPIGFALYLGIVSAVLLIASLWIYIWIGKKGEEKLAEL